MLAKIGFVIGAIALATFTMDRVESLVAHRDFAGSIAWAEDWDSSADDADTEADSQPAAVPDISGVYSGTVNDHLSGSGSADATISQTNNSLTGTFNTFFNSGTLRGEGSSKQQSAYEADGRGRLRSQLQGHLQERQRNHGQLPRNRLQEGQRRPRHARHFPIVT